MSRTAVLAAVLLAGLALPRAAMASGASALAVELSALVLPEESWKKMMSGTAEQTRQLIEASARQAGQPLPPEFAARFVEEFGNIYSYQEIRDMQAGLLVKHYTETELRDLLAFYRSPIGQKAIRIMPEVSQDVNGQVFAVIQQRMPAMIERLKASFENPDDAPATVPAASPAGRKPAAPEKRTR